LRPERAIVERSFEQAQEVVGVKTANINDAREFSLDAVTRNVLLQVDDLEATLLCFEAGQRDEEGVHHGDSLYQVLEGEALVHQGDDRERLGKGRLLVIPAGAPHVLENAGGGLLVVLAVRVR
jgi:mannose-6-phosphate isomerase-like protein (cupin superfamily)